MSTRGRLRLGLVAVVLASAPLASGCGNTQDGAVRSVVEDFYAALADHDGVAACDLLAPRTRSKLEQSSGKECSTAVTEEVQPASDPRRVSVYGTSAQVRYDGETAFLSRYQDGWLVTAASCRPQVSAPYDCSVEGG